MKNAIVFVVRGQKFTYPLNDIEALVMLAAYKLGSESKVAAELGISRTAISKWRQGLSIPTKENLVQLVKLAGARKAA